MPFRLGSMCPSQVTFSKHARASVRHDPLPGHANRWIQVQALLKLDRIDQTCRLLMTARNKCSGEFNTADAEVKGAEEALRRHLDLSSLLNAKVTAQTPEHHCEAFPEGTKHPQRTPRSL
jgi:hypothetical protein